MAGIRRLCRGLILLVLFLAPMLPVTAGDAVTTRDGRTIEGVEVRSWNSPQAPGMFLIAVLEEPDTEPREYPVEDSHVARIAFDTGDGIGGRLARIRMVQGTARDGARVMSFDGAAGSLEVVPPGGGMRVQMALSNVAGITFSPGGMQVAGIRGGEQTAPQATPLPAATPLPVRTPVDAVQSQSDLDLRKAPLADGIAAYGEGEGFTYEMFDEHEYRPPREIPGRAMIPMFDIGIGWVNGGLFLLVSIVWGGLWLWNSSKVEGVPGFGLRKAFITAAALALIPPGLFLAACRFIPMPEIALGVGGVMIYFLDRAIIMGAMEVLEDDANKIVNTFVLVQVGLLFLAAWAL